MPLDATRGLPTFSEMLGAFKNRESLGASLTSGFEGFQKGRANAAAAEKAVGDRELQQSQIKENLAKANKDPLADMVDVRSLEPNMKPEQYNALKMTATTAPDGRLLVSKNTVSQMIPLVRQQSSEDMAAAAQAATEKRTVESMLEARRQAQLAEDERNNRTNKIQEETNKRMAEGQALQAAESTIKDYNKKSPLAKGANWLFKTDDYEQVQQAKKIKAARMANPSKTIMVNPKTGEIAAVDNEEIGSAMQQGFQEQSGN